MKEWSKNGTNTLCIREYFPTLYHMSHIDYKNIKKSKIVKQIRTFGYCGINFLVRVGEKHREYFVYSRAFSHAITENLSTGNRWPGLFYNLKVNVAESE